MQGRAVSLGEDLMSEFKLTYSTMFAAPPALHERFDHALLRVSKSAHREHPLFIGGCDVFTDRKSLKRSPIDQRRILGEFQLAGTAEVERAMRAAADAFMTWRLNPWEERIGVLRKAAHLISSRSMRIKWNKALVSLMDCPMIRSRVAAVAIAAF
jgi:delta 1-pyrroline-5-carboxylate dehydrogenase